MLKIITVGDDKFRVLHEVRNIGYTSDQLEVLKEKYSADETLANHNILIFCDKVIEVSHTKVPTSAELRTPIALPASNVEK